MKPTSEMSSESPCLALKPTQWGNLMSQKYWSSSKDKWQIPTRNNLGSSHTTKDVLHEPLASHHELANSMSPLPSFGLCIVTCFFPKGVRTWYWEDTVLFNLEEEIPLEFSIALGMHTVCTAYASNSFSFTVYDTPPQGQMPFWANQPKGDMLKSKNITRMKMSSWITSMRLRTISPKGELPKEIPRTFHCNLYFPKWISVGQTWPRVKDLKNYQEKTPNSTLKSAWAKGLERAVKKGELMHSL